MPRKLTLTVISVTALVAATIAIMKILHHPPVAQGAAAQSHERMRSDARFSPAPNLNKIIAMLEAIKTKQVTMTRSELATNLKEVLSWSDDHTLTEEDHKSGKAALFYKALSLKASGESGHKFVDDLKARLQANKDFALRDDEFAVFYTESIDPQVLKYLLLFGLHMDDPGVHLAVDSETPDTVTFELHQVPQDGVDPGAAKIEAVIVEGGSVAGAEQLKGLAVPVDKPLKFNVVRQRNKDLLLSLKTTDGSLTSVSVRGTPEKSDKEVALEQQVEALNRLLATANQDLAKSQSDLVAMTHDRDSYANAHFVAIAYQDDGYTSRRSQEYDMGTMGQINDSWGMVIDRGVGLRSSAVLHHDADEGWKFDGDNGPHSWIIKMVR
jgi:hypothetical protein